VLSLRLVIFAALAGVALWGLFSLLDNLREPELLRSTKRVVVKGCDAAESESTLRLCPQLFCQKSLLDARALPLKARFEVTVDRGNSAEHLIGGIARNSASAGEQHFACILQNGRIVAARVLDAAQLKTLSAEPREWHLD
jgi:hypothetical protein